MMAGWLIFILQCDLLATPQGIVHFYDQQRITLDGNHRLGLGAATWLNGSYCLPWGCLLRLQLDPRSTPRLNRLRRLTAWFRYTPTREIFIWRDAVTPADWAALCRTLRWRE